MYNKRKSSHTIVTDFENQKIKTYKNYIERFGILLWKNSPNSTALSSKTK